MNQFVTDRHLGGGGVRPGLVQISARGLNALRDPDVRLGGGLLEVPHEAVHGARVHEVDRHQHGSHDALSGEHRRPHPEGGPEHLEADQQVHALVLGLLQQSRDEAAVLLDAAETAEMSEASGHEARHPRHRLEKNESPLDRPDGRVLLLVARDIVEGVICIRDQVVRKCMLSVYKARS